MQQNLILAGVGGQGILTIARAVCIAALRRGLRVKQSEVHGMAQRGGAVQSHLRIADHELMSDLIPAGQCDLILAVEPLESLRYLAHLRDEGALIANTNAVVNMSNYPPIESVLERIARHPLHIMLDAERLARTVGAARSANIIMLGAASVALKLPVADLEDAVTEMFSAKGPKVVEANRLALLAGRTAAAAYLEGIRGGHSPAAVRAAVDALSLDQLIGLTGPDAPSSRPICTDAVLTRAEASACEQILENAAAEGRRQLFEHEVYTLIELVGAIAPPRYVFVPAGETLAETALADFPGERVVLKLVSPDVVHKSDVGAVRFVPREHDAVVREIGRMTEQAAGRADVRGVLVVEFVEQTAPAFGRELFVGIRATREFGPVIAAGLGGIDTEYLAERLRPGIAVAKAVAADVSAEQFMELFRRTAAYELLSGAARGRRRIVSDGELLRCFRAFLAIARHFCTAGEGARLEELEVNPFALRNLQMTPLDGRGRLGTPAATTPPRPLEKVNKLLEPASIAVLGVSASSMNMGRIILNNIRRCGFDQRHLYVVKPDTAEIDGVRCLPRVAEAPEPIDLLVVAAPANQLPVVIDDVAASGKVASAILIPGGVGETEGSGEIEAKVHAAIASARTRPDGGPVFVGPNCLGIQSRPGRYDTYFIPQHKLDAHFGAPARRCALVSQSGAFIITRLSNLQTLDPALAISIGNQADLTIADFVAVLAHRDDIDVIGVYVEGLRDLDGVAFLRAVERATAAGKVVVFYKAGRTESGRSAAAGHTASVAGDYDVCQAAAAQAGAIVTDTFKEFEQIIELATALHDKRVGGKRIAALSNAGYETVGMADTIRGVRYEVSMPAMGAATSARLCDALKSHGLERLVNARNPLDLTPMATDAAYEDCVRILLEAEEFDAVVVSTVPLTPAMKTTADELREPGSLAERLPRLFAETDKPLIFVVDCGPVYDPLARAIRAAGIPVFRTCDQAIRSLGRYLCHRAPQPAPPATRPEAPAATAGNGTTRATPKRPSPEPAAKS